MTRKNYFRSIYVDTSINKHSCSQANIKLITSADQYVGVALIRPLRRPSLLQSRFWCHLGGQVKSFILPSNARVTRHNLVREVRQVCSRTVCGIVFTRNTALKPPGKLHCEIMLLPSYRDQCSCLILNAYPCLTARGLHSDPQDCDEWSYFNGKCWWIDLPATGNRDMGWYFLFKYVQI